MLCLVGSCEFYFHFLLFLYVVLLMRCVFNIVVIVICLSYKIPYFSITLNSIHIDVINTK